MAYNFSEEQNAIREVVRRIGKEKVAPLAEEIEEKGIPKDLIRFFVDQGIFGLPYPEEYGGGGGETLTFVIIIEELAKFCTNTPMLLLNQKLGALPLLNFGTEEQKSKYLPGILSGKDICSFALTEPDAGSDVGSMKTTARLGGTEYVINGNKQFISMSDIATRLTLFAKTNIKERTKGISAFIVEKPIPGLVVGKHENKMGMRGISNCALIFEDLRIPKENLVGTLGEGFKIAMYTLDLSRPLTAALAVGLAQGALDFAVQYGKQRIQFGRAISQLQGLQFMIAEMAMEIEASRQLTYKAAALVDDRDREISKFGAMAKCFATDVAMKVTTDSIQLCGGYGYMREYPLERKMRDAKLLQIVEGTNQIQRMVIARHVID
jgi:alkylation response protein AidB-like acyl-CoA dehydrogenase